MIFDQNNEKCKHLYQSTNFSKYKSLIRSNFKSVSANFISLFIKSTNQFNLNFYYNLFFYYFFQIN